MEKNQDNANEEIVRNIKSYLEQNNLTQAELGKILDCNQEQISRWVRGRVKVGRLWREKINLAIRSQ